MPALEQRASRIPRFYTPRELAQRIGVSATHIRALIEGGTLLAVDVAAPIKRAIPDATGKPKKRRPRWIIPESEVVAFLIGRGLASACIQSTDATDATYEATAEPTPDGESQS